MGSHPHPPQGDAVTNFLLLHGFLGQPEQWRWLEAELQGRGHTTRALALPRGSWDAEIAFVHEQLLAEGVPTVLVGHSMGGALVRSFATVHPDVAFGLGTIAAIPRDYRASWVAEIGSFDDGRPLHGGCPPVPRARLPGRAAGAGLVPVGAAAVAGSPTGR